MREFNGKRGASSWWQSIRRSKDPAGFIVLFEDSAALIGLAIAGIGVWASHYFANPRIDGFASIAIGLILAGVAILLAREAKGLLIGESADPAIISVLWTILAKRSQISAVNHVRTIHTAPDAVFVAISADFVDDLPMGDAPSQKFIDILGYRRCGRAQRLVDMDVALRDAAGRVSQQCRNREFGVAKPACDTCESVAQDMRCHAFESCSMANSIQDPHYADEVAFSPIGWEEISRTRIGLRRKKPESRLTYHASLRPRFCRPEVNRALLIKEPVALKTECFEPAKASQQQQSDHGYPGRMLVICLSFSERYAEFPDLSLREPPHFGRARNSANAPRGIFFDFAKSHGMFENRVKRRHAARGYAFAAFGGSPPTAHPGLGGRTSSDVGLGAFDITELQCGNYSVA